MSKISGRTAVHPYKNNDDFTEGRSTLRPKPFSSPSSESPKKERPILLVPEEEFETGDGQKMQNAKCKKGDAEPVKASEKSACGSINIRYSRIGIVLMEN